MQTNRSTTPSALPPTRLMLRMRSLIAREFGVRLSLSEADVVRRLYALAHLSNQQELQEMAKELRRLNPQQRL